MTATGITSNHTRTSYFLIYFMGAITFGEHGRFYTPENVTGMMARMVGGGEEGTTVYDPACGSGRTLLAAGKVNPRRTYVGQDLDARGVKMAAISLALYGLRCPVIQGNTLENERHLVNLTGFNGQGVIRLVVPQKQASPAPILPGPIPPAATGQQLTMFEAA